MKGLVALEGIKQTIKLKNDGYINLFETLDFLTIEKELKTLDIIKNKRVEIIEFIIFNTTLTEYNYLYSWKSLTKEEFILLKEVLLWK